jgi:beta-xylosidase
MALADNLNGTFTNPVIHADYPDPDVIRVGDDFYLASSSFTDAPGIPICHSRDLVNWRVIGHVYDHLPASNPAYSIADGQVAYRGGSWAPSIRHHKGVFYVAYCMPNEGFFLAQSSKPEGLTKSTGSAE